MRLGMRSRGRGLVVGGTEALCAIGYVFFVLFVQFACVFKYPVRGERGG